MNYTSLSFVFLFLPLSCLVFYNCDRLCRAACRLLPWTGSGSAPETASLCFNAKRVLLALVSLVFVFLLDRYTFCALLVLLAVGYGCRLVIAKTRGSRFSRLFLAAALVIALLPLFLCKYLALIARTFELPGLIAASESFVIPVGISFFTFRLVMALVDCWRDNQKMDVVDYVSYVLFFPQITSGPIDKTTGFLEWTRSERFGKVDYTVVAEGFVRIVLGMSKKLLLANLLATMADAAFSSHSGTNSTLAIVGILAYSLQIYFDFSGYSDMAIGIGNMLGYRATENFDSPYLARTVGEFWKKWHISLTKFLTWYIYVPLGGNRKGLARTCINILIVFTISGLWHGADWRFVAWGAAYGVILVAERLLKVSAEKVPAFIGRVVTFAVVTLLWVLFRADSFRAALDIVREFLAFDFLPLPESLLAGMHVPELDLAVAKLGLPASFYDFWPYLVLAFALVLSQIGLNSRQVCERKLYLKRPVFVLLVILGVLSVLSFSSSTSFIYWRF